MKYHGIKPVYNVWLSKDDGKYFGPGVAMLIEGVKRTGSLSSAAAPASHRTPSRYFRTLPPSAKRWILR